MNTILLVEDDPQQRQSYADLLKAEFDVSIEILEAGTLAEAEILINTHRDSIAAIILDLDIPEKAGEPQHTKPSPVGLKLLREDAWFCPAIVFSAHENLIDEESTKRCYPWHMILKGAPDSNEQLLEQVRTGIALQKASMQAIPGVANSPRQAVIAPRAGTLAAVHFQPAALRSVSAVLLGRGWSMDAYQEGLMQLQVAVSQQGGTIVEILGTMAACVFPAVGSDPQHFQKALLALRVAFSDIRYAWNGRVRARFSSGLFFGEMDGGVGLGAVYAALPVELACQIALQVEEGQIAIPEAHLAANGLDGHWKGFFGQRVTARIIRLAGGGADIPVSVGSLV